MNSGGGQANCFKVRKLQIRKSLAYSAVEKKSANFSGMSFCKLLIFMKNPQSANPQIYRILHNSVSKQSEKSFLYMIF